MHENLDHSTLWTPRIMGVKHGLVRLNMTGLLQIPADAPTMYFRERATNLDGGADHQRQQYGRLGYAAGNAGNGGSGSQGSGGGGGGTTAPATNTPGAGGNGGNGFLCVFESI